MRIFLRLLLVVLGLGGWAVAGILGLILYSALNKPWDDPISLAARHTSELLSLHETYDETRQIIDWLNAYHGEAPSHQVMISFVEWSLDHREAAESILSSDIAEPAALAQRLAFAASDSGLRCKFDTTFAKSSVPLVVAVLAEIETLNGLQKCESG